MAEIKISEMDELIPYDHYTLEGGTDGADYIPLLDSSEIDPNLQNKKVSIQTLFEDYTRLYNSQPSDGRSVTIDKINLMNNLFKIESSSNLYILLNPGNSPRNVEVLLLNTGDHRYIKNTGAEVITLTNVLSLEGTINLEYEISAYETIQIFFDGLDHHVIYLD